LAHPSTVETTMLLWMGVALVISVLALVIYAVVHVFRHEEQLMKQLQGVGDASPFPTLFSGPRM
jgi:Na+-transporting methylmalonyl-CoA/oxaloacetate decarboxylase gamma subunit